jgi:cell division protein FtsB
MRTSSGGSDLLMHAAAAVSKLTSKMVTPAAAADKPSSSSRSATPPPERPAIGSRLLGQQQQQQAAAQPRRSLARESSDLDSDLDEAATPTSVSSQLPVGPAPAQRGGLLPGRRSEASEAPPASESVKALQAENEKLKAQMMALKDAQVRGGGWGHGLCHCVCTACAGMVLGVVCGLGVFHGWR